MAPYPTLDVAGVSVLVLVADVVLDVVLYPSPDVVVVLQVGVVNNITRATVFLLTLIKYLHQYSKTTAYCVPKPLL